MEEKFKELEDRLREVDDLNSASALLDWDQATYMPPGGGPARARQIATLSRLAHEKFTDEAVGRLLEDLQTYGESQPYDSYAASFIRVARRDYEKAVRVPPAFAAEISSHSSTAYEVWTKARPANDFSAVQPLLEKTLDLSRQLAAFFPGYEHIADPLIDFADYGMKTASVRSLFGELRRELVPLVEAIAAQPVADDTCLHQSYPEGQQLEFGEEVARLFGYDFERGRQDKTHHPFMTKFSLGDVRITTRVKEDDLDEALFSTMHETGHALYEQGIAAALEATLLGTGASMGVHESQSRLWENMVGRSRDFWQFFYPRIQTVFPAQLGTVTLDEFYRAINKVERSLIRTDADEVTYNLHVMIRFELELELLEGSLAVRDLPAAWHQRYQQDLGLAATDDTDGVLQDVHWYSGIIGGAFQGYTLGNILGAQFYEAALRDHPEIPAEIRAGKLATLADWLRENIYQHGSCYTAPELIERVAGEPLSIAPIVRYLKNKFAPLYDI